MSSLESVLLNQFNIFLIDHLERIRKNDFARNTPFAFGDFRHHLLRPFNLQANFSRSISIFRNSLE